jgi:hypothetical protein
MIIDQMATHFVAIASLLSEHPRLYKWCRLAMNKENMGDQELFSGLMIAPFDASPGHHINRSQISRAIEGRMYCQMGALHLARRPMGFILAHDHREGWTPPGFHLLNPVFYRLIEDFSV